MGGASSCIGKGLELCREAEFSELGHQTFGFGLRRAAIEVVSSEVAMRRAGFHHVINGGQDGGGKPAPAQAGGADCVLRSAPAAPAMELRAVVAVLGALGGPGPLPGTLHEHGLQPRS